jgi:glycerol-3-phosphate dehydrogenase (NAD(P)+)
VTAPSERVGIVGAGPFGTALAQALAVAGRDVLIWSARPELVDEIRTRRTNQSRLPGLELHPGVQVTGDPAELAERTRFVVIAVASTDVRSRARILGDVLDGGHLVVHAVAALAAPLDAPTGELRVSDVIAEETPVLRIGALAGPALPGDLVGRRYASMVAASRFDEVTAEARRLLGIPPALRIYTSADPHGVELAAALSGAYTIGIGIADALEVGPGLRAVLVTRAIAEAARVGQAAGADPRSFYGLAGLGNLLVRSAPDSESKDYRLGLALGRGEPMTSQLPTEGARAAVAARRLADKLDVRVPVLSAVAAVLSGELPPRDAAAAAAATVAMEE